MTREIETSLNVVGSAILDGEKFESFPARSQICGRQEIPSSHHRWRGAPRSTSMSEIDSLRGKTKRKMQSNRRTNLNMTIQRLDAELMATKAQP